MMPGQLDSHDAQENIISCDSGIFAAASRESLDHRLLLPVLPEVQTFSLEWREPILESRSVNEQQQIA